MHIIQSMKDGGIKLYLEEDGDLEARTGELST